ncbi:MAG: hypothetical protein Tsb0033_04230 [Winogradskyella sp.]|jgi:hypothetical protein|uniref:Uncharacterized protein n=1 Tax=Winogradskyella alexanderae TaxID=2877123 RepID=A0ABS7XSF9_9FLAO|nr:hypothetical protein [Winogradskyella alexanderae]MCA0132957.1 hypothetical protein [Winogradskyella alexanderae]
MIDTDLYDIEILSSQELNMVELSNVRQLKQENKYLKYGIIVIGIALFGFTAYSIHKKNYSRRSTSALDENYFT